MTEIEIYIVISSRIPTDELRTYDMESCIRALVSQTSDSLRDAYTWLSWQIDTNRLLGNDKQ